MTDDFALFRLMKWSAVYGASVALQVQRKMNDGLGPPSLPEMMRIVEEAQAQAVLAEEAEGALLDGDDGIPDKEARNDE